VHLTPLQRSTYTGVLEQDSPMVTLRSSHYLYLPIAGAFDRQLACGIGEKSKL